MNIFKWLKSKTGKIPLTVAQAVGITAVVGAAGVAALNFFDTPSENNTFVPPSAYEQGDVVYVAQGPNSYDADGAAGSTFKAAPSRSIQLANRQEAQMRQARELEGFTAQPTFEDPIVPTGIEGKAHELSSRETGLGMGGNKQIGNSFEILQNMPDQLNGLGDIIAQQTQAGAQAGAQAPRANGPGKPGAPAKAPTLEGSNGQSAAALANASRNWGNGGLTRAGGSGGAGSSFVVQDSHKNKGDSQAGQAQAMAQAGDAIAQARAAMTRAREGETLRAQANFGPSDRLTGDRNASVRNARNIGGKGANELATIRKHSAALSKNKTNVANAGALPFLAGGQISGGLVVSEDNIVIGQSASSGDLGGRSTSRAQMKGVQARLDEVQEDQDMQEVARDSLKSWMLEAFMVTLGMSVAISILVKLAKGPWAWIFWAAAAVLTAVALTYIWWGAISHIKDYTDACGKDGWSTFGWVLAGVFTASVGLAWFVYPQWISTGMSKLTAVALALVGLGGVAGAGAGIVDLAKKHDSTPVETEENSEHQTADQEE